MGQQPRPPLPPSFQTYPLKNTKNKIKKLNILLMPTCACGLNDDRLDSCWRCASALPEDALRCLRLHIH